MDISALTNVSSEYIKNVLEEKNIPRVQEKGFDSILQSAVEMLQETNSLQHKAEAAEIQFALGYSTNTHDLAIAQEKANIALQYTVAVRDKVLEAYNQIMNMQM